METMSSARIVSDPPHGIATVNPQPGRLKLSGPGKSSKNANKNAKGANNSTRAKIRSNSMRGPMQWFYDLKIAKKLMCVVVMVLALSIFLGLFSVGQLNKVNQAAAEMKNVWLPSLRSVLHIREQLSRLRAVELQYSVVSADANLAPYKKAVTDLFADLNKSVDQYGKLVTEPAEKAVLGRFKAQLGPYMDEHKKIFAAIDAQRAWDVPEMLKGEALNAPRLKLTDIAEELIKINEQGSTRAGTVGDGIYNSGRLWIFGMLAASVLIGCGLALWIARIVSSPLTSAVTLSRKVAAGDLTGEVEVRSRDETGQLMQALKDMNSSLTHIVTEVRSGTDAIATASGEIASGNMDLSTRTEQQAGALEETASSMEEMTQAVKKSADSANQANAFADSASRVALKGSAVVSEVVDTMGLISESAKRIMDIIGVIDGIAFQTNILALNAAVEAARAGEQGRGFAVVASEVRTLAQRSATAAKEIKTLIGDSVNNVATGTKLVGQAGVTMTEMVDGVKKLADIMSEITTATQGQAAGIDRINQALQQMENVTHQNAALVEQGAAASESMREQAENLLRSVSVFKIKDGATTLTLGR
ncbi:MAG TPA: methyl-accepting chemotaxis protein [Herbaspirillum sp.]|jgi:methyl-accepting chemotaxis protein